MRLGSAPEEALLHPERGGVPDVAEVYCFEQMDLAAAALRKGYVDAVAGHAWALMLYYAEESSVPARMLTQPLMTVDLGVAFSLDGDAALAQRLAQTLEEMQTDGTVAAVVAQYGLDGSQVTGG